MMEELDKLFQEWRAWENEVSNITDKPSDKNRETEVCADGKAMMQKHEVLQAPTRTFLNNNIKGHGFIKGFDGSECDRTDLRLKHRVEHKLKNQRILIASLEYARVPELYWKEKGKELGDKFVDKSRNAVVDIAASYLKKHDE